MPIEPIRRLGTLQNHEDRIRDLERQIKRLASPAMSSVAIVATSAVPDLELYDGNTFISKDSSPTLCYVVGGTIFALSGSPS